ncbi:MAG: PilZ domain-containing protein [Bacteriovoracia bacterium]
MISDRIRRWRESILSFLGLQRQRSPRIQVVAIHDAMFFPEGIGEVVSLGNVSTGGMGVLKTSRQTWPEPGHTLKGRLKIGKFEVETRCRVVHVSEQYVGCQFETNLASIESVVASFFRVELAAMKLIEVNPDVLAKSEEGEVTWYRGANNCDLFLVEVGGKIEKFHFTFFGNYFQGGRDQDLKSGSLLDDEHPGKPHYKGAAVITDLRSPSAEMLKLARRYVGAVRNLDNPRREALLGHITRAGG